MESIADYVSPDLDHAFLGYDENQTQVFRVVFRVQGFRLPGVRVSRPGGLWEYCQGSPEGMVTVE